MPGTPPHHRARETAGTERSGRTVVKRRAVRSPRTPLGPLGRCYSKPLVKNVLVDDLNGRRGKPRGRRVFFLLGHLLPSGCVVRDTF